MIKRWKFQETTASTLSYSSAGKITLRVIQKGMSKNRRFYPENVLRKSYPIFEGAKMFTEHSDNNGVKEWVGVVNTPWVESDGTVMATAQIIDPDFKTKLELLKAAGKLNQMGVSISCAGTATEGEEDGQRCMIVESLDECRSVDFVAHPAAGGRVEVLESTQRSIHDRLKAGFRFFGLSPAEAALAARGPMQNGTEIDVQLRGKAFLDRLNLMEPE